MPNATATQAPGSIASLARHRPSIRPLQCATSQFTVLQCSAAKQPEIKRLPMALFTSEMAKAYRVKSLASYRRNRILEKQRAEREAQAAFTPPQPTPLPVEPPPIAPPQPKPLDDFCEKRIARVRKQLETIDAMIAKELDPQRLDRLASAQSRVSEQERILSGRPLPGSQRPRAIKAPKVNGSAVEPE